MDKRLETNQSRPLCRCIDSRVLCPGRCSVCATSGALREQRRGASPASSAARGGRRGRPRLPGDRYPPRTQGGSWGAGGHRLPGRGGRGAGGGAGGTGRGGGGRAQRGPPRPQHRGAVSGMEPWKQCGQWLISCKVLPPNHRVTWDTAQVFDLAQTLRDGVLLCQLLNNLRSHSINLKEINLRPQMSQVRPRGCRPTRAPLCPLRGGFRGCWRAPRGNGGTRGVGCGRGCCSVPSPEPAGPLPPGGERRLQPGQPPPGSRSLPCGSPAGPGRRERARPKLRAGGSQNPREGSLPAAGGGSGGSLPESRPSLSCGSHTGHTVTSGRLC